MRQCLLLLLMLLLQSEVNQAHVKHKGGFHDDSVMLDKDHISEHLHNDFGIDKDPKDMTQAELEFYEFKAHDYDKNDKLDGIEMLSSMSHFNLIDPSSMLSEEERRKLTPQQIRDKQNQVIEEKYTAIESEVDHLLKEHDTDHDGYISYAEYLLARWEQEDKQHGN